MSAPALQARGVRKAFGADGVLERIDLSVRENEILLLMGPNGVGKTVLLSCLAGSEQPSAGEIEAFGRPVGAAPGTDRVFLRQDSMAVETLTGRENARFYGRLHPNFTDRWETHAAQLELTADLDKRVEHYSGGMRRKLELALAMSVDVPLYILDEPTAGVDLSMIQRFHDIILGRRDAGAAVLISSHRPMDAELADRIAFMRDGSITAVGPPDELLDGLPTVVRVTGAEAMVAVPEHLVGGQLFPLGGEGRGFLPPETSVADLESALAAAGVDDARLETIEPTDAELFNYYVHVRPEVAAE